MQIDFLGLDTASVTGWAHSANPSAFSGTWNIGIKQYESSGMRLIRFAKLLREVVTYNSEASTLVIAYEQPIIAQGKRASLPATMLHSQLVGIVQVIAEDHGIECCGYHLSTVKAHALKDQPRGSKRDKVAMVAAAERKWDFPFIDDNLADALCLMDLAISEWGTR